MVRRNDPGEGEDPDPADRDFEKERQALVESLRNRGYIETDQVEEAFLNVPRHEFVPDSVRERAYSDRPLRIGEGQTISAPHMVAMMTELLDLAPDSKVLEIGTGRGYHAAIVAEIVGGENVFTIERHESLARNARQNLEKTGYGDVSVGSGDGSKGWEEHAPYDRIYLTCAAPEVPEPLKQQLRNGGMMVLPIGRTAQTLYSVKKVGNKYKKESHGGVRFVPLLGEEGF